LSSLDRGRLINVSLVIDIEFAESILQTEDLVLLELRILPVPLQVSKDSRNQGSQTIVKAYLCNLITFILVVFVVDLYFEPWKGLRWKFVCSGEVSDGKDAGY
jgi:hypothetical protein